MDGQEEMQETVEKTFDSVFKEIHSVFLRKKQAEMHRCALNCYERPNGNMKSDAECAGKCQLPSARAGEIFGLAVEEYKRTLTTCLDSCADEIRYVKEISRENEEKVKSCSKKCIDAFVSRKNSVVAKCLERLNSGT